MNEKVLKDLYNRAKSKGYQTSENEFRQLLYSNSDVFSDNYKYVQGKGYKKSENDFKSLIGFETKEVAPAVEKVATEEVAQQIATPEIASTVATETTTPETPTIQAPALTPEPAAETPPWTMEKGFEQMKEQETQTDKEAFKQATTPAVEPVADAVTPLKQEEPKTLAGLSEKIEAQKEIFTTPEEDEKLEQRGEPWVEGRDVGVYNVNAPFPSKNYFDNEEQLKQSEYDNTSATSMYEDVFKDLLSDENSNKLMKAVEGNLATSTQALEIAEQEQKENPTKEGYAKYSTAFNQYKKDFESYNSAARTVSETMQKKYGEVWSMSAKDLSSRLKRTRTTHEDNNWTYLNAFEKRVIDNYVGFLQQKDPSFGYEYKKMDGSEELVTISDYESREDFENAIRDGQIAKNEQVVGWTDGDKKNPEGSAITKEVYKPLFGESLDEKFEFYGKAFAHQKDLLNASAKQEKQKALYEIKDPKKREEALSAIDAKYDGYKMLVNKSLANFYDEKFGYWLDKSEEVAQKQREEIIENEIWQEQIDKKDKAAREAGGLAWLRPYF